MNPTTTPVVGWDGARFVLSDDTAAVWAVTAADGGTAWTLPVAGQVVAVDGTLVVVGPDGSLTALEPTS